jgi:hypothetical protein
MTRMAMAIGAVLVATGWAWAGEGTVAFEGPTTAMEQADKNHDGMLDHGEYYERQVDVFFLLDRDKDGRLTATEIGEVDVDRFARCDRDKDGTLTLSEFTAAREKDFDQADTNHDEVLYVSEIEAASRPSAKKTH